MTYMCMLVKYTGVLCSNEVVVFCLSADIFFVFVVLYLVVFILIFTHSGTEC